MGYSLSWAALKGGNLQSACAALGLRATGKREEIAESKIAGAALPSGWYVIVFNRTEIKDKTLEKLSQAGEVVGCFVEDHVMFSSASAWKNGRRVWYVAHNGEEDRVLHLETSGQLPPEFEEIRKKVFAEQEQENAGRKEVDYVFELPAELAKELTGFRHDQSTAGNVYEGLESAIGGENSLLARIATTLEGSSTSSIAGLVVLMILFSPVLLVAALIAVPWVLTTRLVGRLAQKWR